MKCGMQNTTRVIFFQILGWVLHMSVHYLLGPSAHKHAQGCIPKRLLGRPDEALGGGNQGPSAPGWGRHPLRFGLRPQGPCRVGTGESGLVLSEEGNPAG